jgi:hypothetical protein
VGFALNLFSETIYKILNKNHFISFLLINFPILFIIDNLENSRYRMVIDLFPTSALSTSLNTQQLAKQVRFLVNTFLDTQRRLKDLPFP